MCVCVCVCGCLNPICASALAWRPSTLRRNKRIANGNELLVHLPKSGSFIGDKFEDYNLGTTQKAYRTALPIKSQDIYAHIYGI